MYRVVQILKDDPHAYPPFEEHSISEYAASLLSKMDQAELVNTLSRLLEVLIQREVLEGDELLDILNVDNPGYKIGIGKPFDDSE